MPVIRLGLCINVDYFYYPLPKVLNEMMNQVIYLPGSIMVIYYYFHKKSRGYIDLSLPSGGERT